MRIATLTLADLDAARALLDRSCAYDRAGVVAEEKLFGRAPAGEATAFGAFDRDSLVGVASICGNRLRLLAVETCSRRGGAGGALLDHCIAAVKAAGHDTIRTLDQPGNYLAPGIDVGNRTAIGWLERRGFTRLADERANCIVAVRDNPRVSIDRTESTAAELRAKGFEIRRARRDETALVEAVRAEFGNAWPFEIERALEHDPPGVHVALRDGAYCAFAAHDGNNRGLGWFGPTGTWPEYRGNRLGEALLLACLSDVAAVHDRCEIAWIGPRAFYDKVAGVVADRRFTVLTRPV